MLMVTNPTARRSLCRYVTPYSARTIPVRDVGLGSVSTVMAERTQKRQKSNARTLKFGEGWSNWAPRMAPSSCPFGPPEGPANPIEMLQRFTARCDGPVTACAAASTGAHATNNRIMIAARMNFSVLFLMALLLHKHQT